MSSEFGAIKFSCRIKVNRTAGLWLQCTALLTAESIFSFFRQFIGFVYFDLIACGISQTLACHFRKPLFPVCMDGWMEASKQARKSLLQFQTCHCHIISAAICQTEIHGFHLSHLSEWNPWKKHIWNLWFWGNHHKQKENCVHNNIIMYPKPLH